MSKVLFEAYDVTEHVYTWDYQKAETALHLLDGGESRFVLITAYSHTDEETGAMGDYRTGSWLAAHVYDKATLEEIGEFDLSTDSARRGDYGELCRALGGEPWRLTLTEVGAIACEQGTVRLCEGNLVVQD